MSKKYRDLYAEKVAAKKAIPETEDENVLFQLARMEDDSEQLAKIDKLVGMIAKKKQGGAPRKTAGDVELAQQLLKQHDGNVKLARGDFIKIVTKRDKIGKQRARERFQRALETRKT